MAYFIPSSIQKRLLRYALSRLEFLDTDALDLQNLDIGWGRKSTVELKDVSLRKTKLASLLKLPERLTIEDARVALLRVTVPADLHTAPILIYIQGVDAKGRLHEDEAHDVSVPKSSRTYRQRESQGRKGLNRTKSPTGRRPPVRRKSSADFEDDHGPDVLPTTRDLAASFLAEEPEEEGELQAAINSQSTDLRQSVASSDSGDDGLVYGTGVGLSLPAFLADFLKGIVDRLQIVVSKISVKVDASFDPTLEENSRPLSTGNLSETTIGVFIDTVNVSQAGQKIADSNPLKEDDTPDNASEREQNISVGNRCILVRGIHGSLLSDAATFAQLSQIFEKTDDGSSSSRAAKYRSAEATADRESYNDPSITPSRHDPEKMYDSIPSLASGVPSPSLLSAVPETESRRERESALEDSRTSPLEDSLPYSLDSSQNPLASFSHNALSRFRERKSSAERTPQSMPELGGLLPNESAGPSLANSIQNSMKMPGEFQFEADPSLGSSSPQIFGTSPTAMFDLGDQETPIVPSDDGMAESRVFSHSEAESIYMSAVHNLDDENSDQLGIPGGWNVDPSSSVSRTAPALSHMDDGDDEIPARTAEDHGFTVSSPEQPTKPFENIALSKAEFTTYDSMGNTETEHPTSMSASPGSDKMSVRPLFNVSECRILLPTSLAEDSETTPPPRAYETPKTSASLSGSEYRTVPGAFSVYAETRASILKDSRPPEQVHPAADSETRSSSTLASNTFGIEMSFGNFKVKTDIFTIRLLTCLVRKLQLAFQRGETPASSEVPQEVVKHQKTSHFTKGLSLTINAFEITFVDAVADKTYDRSSISYPDSTAFDSPSEKVLFALNLGVISMRTSNLESMVPLRIEVGTFKFGFADEDIISCSRETSLRASLRDVREIRDKDISLEIGVVNDSQEINIATQPIKISVNLQKLDYTLGLIGGLSSLLELGSSIVSDTTVVSPTPKSQQRARTVRFESSTTLPSDLTHETHVRLNLKFSGAYVAIKGITSRIACQSSAIKIVARNSLIGAQVDDIRLSGPHTGLGSEHAPLVFRIRDTRLKYLFGPEEHDITRLISLLTPSKDKFEEDDDFLVDTLVRQRKKGAVLRVTVSSLYLDCDDPDAVESLQELSTEASKMSAVTRFLPKESRPGLLTLALVDNIHLNLQTGTKLGQLSVSLDRTEVAHVTAPSLMAIASGKVDVGSEMDHKLLTAVIPENCNPDQPMLMGRMIEDELEPAIKIKLWNVCFEYSVPVLMAILNRDEEKTLGKDIVDDMTASIIALTEKPIFKKSSTQSSNSSENSKPDSKPLKLDLALRDCAVGLKPRKLPSKSLFVMADVRILTGLPTVHGFRLSVELRKADLLLTNDAEKLTNGNEAHVADRDLLRSNSVSQVDGLRRKGYVSVTSISAATLLVKVTSGMDSQNTVEVDFQDKLFVLETCADSTQTLIETLSDLAPPTPPSKDQKYRTEIAPVEDMMASFTGDAFAVGEKTVVGLSDIHGDGDYEDDLTSDFDTLGYIQATDVDLLSDDFESDIDGGLDDVDEISGHGIEISTPRQTPVQSISGAFAPRFLPPQVQGTANKWDSANNKYLPVEKTELSASPFKLRITDTHIIWNLYDGYDWERTRDTITKAVHDVEAKAAERRKGKRTSFEDDQDDESVIGDFLFNSIYVGVPINHDPKDLSRQINRNIDDLVSETGSHTPSHTSTATSRPPGSPRTKSHGRRLKLERSRRHKIAFELRGLSVDFFLFPPGGETQSSTDIRIEDFEIFDHVPTSTWKKFATYMHDAGSREDNKPMLHLEVCDVRPVPELTAAELVVRVTLLPIRLHVDQDALDFITRFFEFNDDSKSSEGSQAEQPYLQRVEVRPVPVKLDYKPKKVDYAGLRSGRTTEFMNFFILDGAEFTLKHVIIYGTSGFLKLHRSLEDVWMPDVKKNQLPSVLSGLNGVRTFVNVGTGVRDLVAIPIREYKKDGRIVRSISKGAMAFARTTGSELTRFGAKVAVGAQNALQGAEGLFVQQNQSHEAGWEEMDLDPEEKRATSHYANQPAGILQGLKGAARSLERDLLVTRDAIVAISGEVRESDSAEGAALVVARHAPTLILRPMIGATKAISQTLMGATNTVDPQNRRRLEDKYKRY